MMLDDQHLARARRAGHPILTPGDHAYWDLDNTLIKVTVLGGGDYEAIGGTRDGVTVKVNSTVTVDPSRGEIQRGAIRVVAAARIVPRDIVTTDPERGHTYAGHTWAFDLTCRVHGEIHTAPISPCRFNRTEIALIDEITDATEHGRIINHAAAREIVAWYTEPGNTSVAAQFVRNGQLPGEDTDTVWTALGGYNLDLEKAEWRRAGLRALREYVRVSYKPRHPFSTTLFITWAEMELWELDYDGRYQISPERFSELGGEPQTRWVVRFCDDRAGRAAAGRAPPRHPRHGTHCGQFGPRRATVIPEHRTPFL